MSLVHRIRDYLGTKTALELLHALSNRLQYLEDQMATTAEQIDALATKVDGVGTVAADILADFRAFKLAVEADREEPTEAIQAALDRANERIDANVAKLTELDVEVGDADGSDTPPVEPPVDPEPTPDPDVLR